MVEGASARLDGLPPSLGPLTDVARGLLDPPGDLSADGVLRLGHRPWVAPENYAVILYPGLSAAGADRFAARSGLAVPAAYAGFLSAVNGAFCFGMSLAGASGSSLLDRTRLRCHDLVTAATLWASEYRRLPAGALGFGGRYWSQRENVGYFVVGGRILSIRKNGRVVGEWVGLADFLRDELRASAALDAELYPPPAG